jgi:segregation and condensation protein B
VNDEPKPDGPDPGNKPAPGGEGDPEDGTDEGRPLPPAEPGPEAPGGVDDPGSPEAVPAGAFLSGEDTGPGVPPKEGPAPDPTCQASPAEPISDEDVAADLASAARTPVAEAPAPAEPAPAAPAPEPPAEPQAPPPPPGKGAVEALLFAAETPLTPAQLASFLGKGIKAQDVKGWIEELQADYEQSGRSFGMEEIGGGFRLMTRPEYFPYVRNLKAQERSSRLTEASLDTLAVVAYRQPILKADVNQIRGVESGPILKTLMEKGLIRAVGRAEALGRPILYGTTKAFLDFFGLKSLKDLPKPEK